MTERTLHIHRCACGTEWECSKPDCYIGDECSRCEDEALAIWVDAHDPQPELPHLTLKGTHESQ